MSLRPVPERFAQNVGGILLDEDPPLEGEPGREVVARGLHVVVLGIRRRVAIEYPPMRVSRVAVGAAKRASDVRVDRPETHTRRFGSVQYRARNCAVVADVLLLTNQRQRTT